MSSSWPRQIFVDEVDVRLDQRERVSCSTQLKGHTPIGTGSVAPIRQGDDDVGN